MPRDCDYRQIRHTTRHKATSLYRKPQTAFFDIGFWTSKAADYISSRSVGPIKRERYGRGIQSRPEHCWLSVFLFLQGVGNTTMEPPRVVQQWTDNSTLSRNKTWM
jgi:hypothetical protein